jgi:hypothetical protein
VAGWLAGKDGYRDMLFTQDVGGGGGVEGPPTEVFGFAARWSGWWFTADGIGLMRERRWKDRNEVAWRLDADGTRVKLWERMYQDRYGDPGSPEEDYNSAHQLVLQTATAPADAGGEADGDAAMPWIYFMGNGASPRGDRPFVDARPLAPLQGGGGTALLKPTRIWRCPPGPTKPGDADEIASAEVGGELAPEEGREAIFESPVYILGSQGQLLLLRRESNAEPPNYLIRNMQTGEDTSLTDNAHPQPSLAATTSEIINYKRKDGISLNAKLYLPAGYNPERDGPRPCLMWAYPGEFKDAKAAGQVKESPYRFTRAHWSRPLIWLAEGWVVLERFAMPILGEGDNEPNDTFVQQVRSFACLRACVSVCLCACVRACLRACVRAPTLEPCWTCGLIPEAIACCLVVLPALRCSHRNNCVAKVVANAEAACEEVIRRYVMPSVLLHQRQKYISPLFDREAIRTVSGGLKRTAVTQRMRLCCCEPEV